MRISNLVSISVAITAGLAVAGKPPKPEGIEVLKSQLFPNVSLSYKETHICPNAVGYSGYIHLPPSPPHQDYEAHIYFLFFPAAESPETAPLAVWFEGGPGGPSTPDFFSGIGPCNPKASLDGTDPNPWSWHQNANIIAIDQPITTGFTHTAGGIVPAALNVSWTDQTRLMLGVTPNDSGLGAAAGGQNTEVVYGEQALKLCKKGKWVTFPNDGKNVFDGSSVDTYGFACGMLPKNEVSQESYPKTTKQAAVAIWRFFQGWFELAPFHRPETPSLHFWSYSYGGQWAPGFASYFVSQTDALLADPDAVGIPIEVKGVGVINGVIDMYRQKKTFLDFANNNTFGIQTLNNTWYKTLTHEYDEKCGPLYEECQQLLAEHDPEHWGRDKETMEKCNEARTCIDINSQNWAVEYLLDQFGKGNEVDLRIATWSDFSGYMDSSFAVPSVFMNEEWVQKELGIEMNDTHALGVSMVIRGNMVAAIAANMVVNNYTNELSSMLQHGISVTLAGGDLDQMLGWQSQELVALNMDYTLGSGASLRDAAWADLVLDGDSPGGLTRQVGNLSVSRVFNASHTSFVDQPATLYKIFSRAVLGVDVATGQIEVSGSNAQEYLSGGIPDSFAVQFPRRGAGERFCHWALTGRCSRDEFRAMANGSAIVENYLFVGFEGDENDDC